MTIQSKINSFTQLKGKIVITVDYYDDKEPQKILIRKIYEATSLEAIKDKIEFEEDKIELKISNENPIEKELRSFVESRNKIRKLKNKDGIK